RRLTANHVDRHTDRRPAATRPCSHGVGAKRTDAVAKRGAVMASSTVGTPAKAKSAKKKPASPPKSVLQEGDDIAVASTMIALGARLQVLESETSLSYERLSRLYREIHGCSAPRGMLPFSAEWFMNWRANVHSSIFY